MLLQMLVSLLGIVILHRNLSLVEKFQVVSSSKLKTAFYFLQLPIYFYIYFKELIAVVTTYIGIFLVTLMLFDKIIEQFREKTFEKLHLHLISQLILHLKVGKSASTSVKIVFTALNSFEKATFQRLQHHFSEKNLRSLELDEFHADYFAELQLILSSSSQVSEQLKAFRDFLKLQKSLRHRSGQALQQARAQAYVCAVLYLVFVILSYYFFKLDLLSLTFAGSCLLFLCGELLVFRLGKGFRCKT